MAAFAVCFRLYRRKGEQAAATPFPKEQPWHQRVAGCGEIRSANAWTGGRRPRGAHVTTITRFQIGAAIAAMFLTATLAVPVAARQEVPFKGTFQGSDTVTPPATIATAATGTGTHLGQFSFTHVLAVNTLTGSAH
jgi:hypothetical protein